MRITALAFSLVCLVSAAAAQQAKIVVVTTDQDLVRELQSVTPKARIVAVTPANVLQEIADADAFFGEPTPEQVRAAKKLRWVQTRSAGVERVLHRSGGNDLRDGNIILTNNQIVQGPEIADHALAMLLALSREIPQFVKAQPRQEWRVRPYRGIELNGRTAVVVGLGGIGTQIAVRAHAFGMQVIGVDPEDIPYLPFVQKVVKPDQFDDVLPQADVVFIAAPHTTASHKMMGMRQFDLLKPGSYFIAVSRGGLYDLDALVQSLQSNRLAGAGVDVTDPEPLPKGHPLWSIENVIITPHVAGSSDKVGARMMTTFKENILRFVEGKPLINVVDKAKGY
jgi:phosphoglycerate dehydrogenase-like enzyme